MAKINQNKFMTIIGIIMVIAYIFQVGFVFMGTALIGLIGGMTLLGIEDNIKKQEGIE